MSKRFKSCQFTAPRHRIRLAAVSGQRQQGWVSGLASRLPTTEADTDCTEACRRHTERAAGTSLNLTLQGERRGGVGASEAGGGRDGPAAAGGHMGECSGSAAGAAMELHGFVGLGVAAMPMAAPHGPATSLQITTSPPPPPPPPSPPPPLPPEINPIISTLRFFECKSSASWHFITCATTSATTSIAFLIFATIDVSNKKWC